jgi:hypothetical protein
MVRTPKTFAAVAVATLILVAFASCSRVPSDEQVRSDFLREHPTFDVQFVGVGEGDGSAAYFHIRYRKPDDANLYEDVWQYLDTGDGRWRINHKETSSKPLSTPTI